MTYDQEPPERPVPPPPHYAPPYRNPRRDVRPSAGWAVFQFSVGFGGSFVISLFLWKSGAQPIRGCLGVSVYALIKMSLGLALTWEDRWRPMGAGILMSMGIGALMLPSLCAKI